MVACEVLVEELWEIVVYQLCLERQRQAQGA